jgi:hypothetical protein
VSPAPPPGPTNTSDTPPAGDAAARRCRYAPPRRATATGRLWQAAGVEHGDHQEVERPVRWVVDLGASFGGMADGFEVGFRASIADAAAGPVAVTSSSNGIRATFELEGLRRDQVETSARAIGNNALRAGAASVRNPTPGPHGWNLTVGVEPA